jgi:hypothetical protein
MTSGLSPQKKMKQNLKNPKKYSNHSTLLIETEILKLSNEMRLKKEGQKWDPSHLYSIKGIKGKAPSTP